MPNDGLEKLATRLAGEPFGLENVSGQRIEDLWKPNDRRSLTRRSFTVSPDLQIAGYLRLNPDILIADCLLGTVGLVHFLGRNPANDARLIIDKATYLRHLLLMDAGADARPARRAFSVECVLILPSTEAEVELKEVFRDTASETAFWHSIGASVLTWPANEEVRGESLRRAFPWLLPATRKWFQDPIPPPGRVVRAMSLRNYRLSGGRKLVLHASPGIHIFHGQNGTGKSSIAEALELSVTGTVTRLRNMNVSDYAQVICNRHSEGPAFVQLEFSSGPEWKSEIGRSGINAPLQSSMPASGFRLDQDSMDELARKGPEQRAEIFLRSFFPHDLAANRTLNEARTALENIVRSLPPDIQISVQSLSAEQKAVALEDRFSWLSNPGPPTREQLRSCEPISRDSLDALRVFSADVGAYLDTPEFRDRTHFEQLFGAFNEALERIRARSTTLLESIRASRQILSEETVYSWLPAETGAAAQSWNGLLERWTEQMALADLAQTHWNICRILADAKASWMLPPDVKPVALFDQTVDSLAAALTPLEQLRASAAAERDKLYQRLTESARKGQRSATEHTRLPHLSERQMSALDLAGECLVAGPAGAVEPGKSPERLGHMLHRAFTENLTPLFAGVTIGGFEQWAKELSDKFSPVEKALAALTRLEQTETGTREQPWMGPVQRMEALSAAMRAAQVLKEAAAAVKEAFLTELRNKNLNAALNELIALFTPARWAYQDVVITRTNINGKEALEFEIEGAESTSAELLLNTAELNVFTIALYVLSAVRNPNPLGVLVFDDPLQNMDELTVTAVARGLAKVAQFFPSGWKLIFLFHGEDDLERFRQEIPAAVYKLPWLAPSAGPSDDVTVEADPVKSTFNSTLQNLSNVLMSWPRYAGATR